jgi:hypothetical protein
MEDLKKEIMKIMVTTTFDDTKTEKRVKANTELTKDIERGKEIIKSGCAKLVSIEKILDEEKVEKALSSKDLKIIELENQIKELLEKKEKITEKNDDKKDKTEKEEKK